MKVRLTSQEKDLLIDVKKRFHWEGILSFRKYGIIIVLEGLEEEDAIELRELCSDYLLEVGFDDAYIANDKGKILEQLVDKLYVE